MSHESSNIRLFVAVEGKTDLVPLESCLQLHGADRSSTEATMVEERVSGGRGNSSRGKVADDELVEPRIAPRAKSRTKSISDSKAAVRQSHLGRDTYDTPKRKASKASKASRDHSATSDYDGSKDKPGQQVRELLDNAEGSASEETLVMSERRMKEMLDTAVDEMKRLVVGALKAMSSTAEDMKHGMDELSGKLEGMSQQAIEHGGPKLVTSTTSEDMIKADQISRAASPVPSTGSSIVLDEDIQNPLLSRDNIIENELDEAVAVKIPPMMSPNVTYQPSTQPLQLLRKADGSEDLRRTSQSLSRPTGEEVIASTAKTLHHHIVDSIKVDDRDGASSEQSSKHHWAGTSSMSHRSAADTATVYSEQNPTASSDVSTTSGSKPAKPRAASDELDNEGDPQDNDTATIDGDEAVSSQSGKAPQHKTEGKKKGKRGKKGSSKK